VINYNKKINEKKLKLRRKTHENEMFALQDMFTVEVKDSQCELSVSVNSLDDLYLGDVIASDGCGTVFSAEIRQYRPGIICLVN